MKPWKEYESKVPYPKQGRQTANTGRELALYREGVREGEKQFFADARMELGYDTLLSEKGCYMLETKAWDDGHSGGFSEVFIHLSDLTDFVKGLYPEYHTNRK